MTSPRRRRRNRCKNLLRSRKPLTANVWLEIRRWKVMRATVSRPAAPELYTIADCRKILRMVNEDWETPAEKRVEIIDRLMASVEQPEDDELAIEASRCVVAMWEANKRMDEAEGR